MKKSKLILLSMTILPFSSYAITDLKWDSINVKHIEQHTAEKTYKGYSFNMTKEVSPRTLVFSGVESLSSDTLDSNDSRSSFLFGVGYYENFSASVTGYSYISIKITNLSAKIHSLNPSFSSMSLKSDNNLISLTSGIRYRYNENIDADFNFIINKDKNNSYIKSESTVYYNFSPNLSLGAGASFSSKSEYEESSYNIVFRTFI